jgi:hypothetical protein
MVAKMNMTHPMESAAVHEQPRASRYVTEEQFLYADLLDKGMRVGLMLLVISFTLYVSGLATPVIPLNELPAYWSLPVAQYLKMAGLGTGWSWVGLIARGDFMNFVGIAFLSTITIICYARILVVSVRTRQALFSAIVLAEVLVLCLGASGLLTAGH